MKRIYFAFPYSSSPLERTAEVVALVRGLLKVRQDFLPFVPHVMFDSLLGHPEGYEHTYVLEWEFEIIGLICDYICFPPVPDGVPVSVGCLWERHFALWMGVPVLEWDYLLEGGEI